MPRRDPVSIVKFDERRCAVRNGGYCFATDEHRAVNYLAVRDPEIHARAAEQFQRGESLSAVEVRASPLSGTRKIVDVIYSYTNRSTDATEKWSVRVDVTEEFPFLVSKLSPYFDR